jgi:hypothetical protein
MKRYLKAALPLAAACLLAGCEPGADDMKEAAHRNPQFQAMLMMVMPPGTRDVRAGLERFKQNAVVEKSGCVSATNAPGYVCDFRWGQKQPNGSTRFGNPLKGRFYKADNGWQVEIAK